MEETPIWVPQPGPQETAYYTSADVVFYGGGAGGGKTDLLIGKAVTRHKRSMIFRKQATQLTGIVERASEILGGRDGYNGQDKLWRVNHDGIDRLLQFGSCPNPGDWQKYMGQAHSLKGFDEITHFTYHEFRMLKGWKRSVDEDDPQQVLCTGNPPGTGDDEDGDADGEWVLEYWAPWLDPNHPNPAEPGELRYYVTFEGEEKDREVDGPEPVTDPKTGEQVTPESRTFIPALVEDNEFLMATGYKETLQSMPEPYRSQLLKGDFKAGRVDNAWQVVPTEWVEQAMARWRPMEDYGTYLPMDSMGCDVARGGKDKTVVVCRHGGWYDYPKSLPGAATPNGQTGAAFVLQHRRDQSPVHVDVIGVGGSVYDHLYENNIQTLPIDVSRGTSKVSAYGNMKFKNVRSQLHWEFRESLDPRSESMIALPPDPELKADLCAARYKITPTGIQVESKEDIKKRIGRSPDKGDAVLLAHIVTPKAELYDEYDDYHADDGRDSRTGY